MTKPLSPAAAAVLNAAMQYEINPECYSREIAAAALRAAADQVVPERPLAYGGRYTDGAANEQVVIRSELLAIAAELEGADG